MYVRCSIAKMLFLLINLFFFQNDLVQTSSAISEYDLLIEGDLFKAPEPILEEPAIDLDPVEAAISMISCGEDVPSQGLKSSDINILQNEQLLSEVFYECKKDLLEKTVIESPLTDIMEIKVPPLNIEDNSIEGNKPLPHMTLPKSISSGSLSSMDWMHGPAMKPTFLDFPGLDFNAVYGMRRAFSEGDIKVKLKLIHLLCACLEVKALVFCQRRKLHLYQLILIELLFTHDSCSNTDKENGKDMTKCDCFLFYMV